MAIFSNTAFTPVVEELYPNIEPTYECAHEIALEGYRDMHKLVSALFVSDILIENSVMEGAEAEPLIEGAVKELAAKAKARISAIWAKIKAWFKAVRDRLVVRLTSSKDFVKKYKDQIKKKDLKGFRVSKHNFNTGVDTSATIMMDKIVSFADSEGKNGKTEDFNSRAIKAVDSKASDISELKKNFVDEHVGDKKDDQSVSSSDIDGMIKFCENMNVTLSVLKDLESKNEGLVKKMMSGLDGSGENADVVRAKTQNYSFALRVIQELNATAVEIVKKINTEYVSILRSAMLFRPAKESFTPDEEMMKQSSIFESALAMI